MRMLLIMLLALLLSACGGRLGLVPEAPSTPAYDLNGLWKLAGPVKCHSNDRSIDPLYYEDGFKKTIRTSVPLRFTHAGNVLEMDEVGRKHWMTAVISGNRVSYSFETMIGGRRVKKYSEGTVTSNNLINVEMNHIRPDEAQSFLLCTHYIKRLP